MRPVVVFVAMVWGVVFSAILDADIVEFRLTGNSGNGLQSGNVTPGTGSVGEGGIANSDLTFDTDTNILHVHVHWGTGNGYSGDLTGPITLLHLHGPTDSPPPDAFSQTGPLLVTLSNSLSFNSSPIEGGVNDNYFINNSDVTALLQGRTYINVHTDSFPSGEIRGYLVTVPEPSAAWLAALISISVFRRRRNG